MHLFRLAQSFACAGVEVKGVLISFLPHCEANCPTKKIKNKNNVNLVNSYLFIDSKEKSRISPMSIDLTSFLNSN